MTRLPEQVEPSTIFLLRAMDDDLLHQHHGNPDASVYGPHQSYDDPTIGVFTRPGVGMSPLCCEVAGYPFKGSQRLHIQ